MVREGEAPPPNGCGSSMTRTSTPRLAASSRALITLRSLRMYISSQTDFCAPLIAPVIGLSPAFGSTITRTPCTPEPAVQLLRQGPPPLLPVPPTPILISHPASSTQSTARIRYVRETIPILYL